MLLRQGRPVLGGRGSAVRSGSGGGTTGTCPLRRLPTARGGTDGERSPQLCSAAGSPSNLAGVGPGLLRPFPSAPSGGENAEEEARADSAQPRSGWLHRQRDQLCRVSEAGLGVAGAAPHPLSCIPEVTGAAAAAAAFPGTGPRRRLPGKPRSEAANGPRRCWVRFSLSRLVFRRHGLISRKIKVIDSGGVRGPFVVAAESLLSGLSG